MVCIRPLTLSGPEEKGVIAERARLGAVSRCSSDLLWSTFSKIVRAEPSSAPGSRHFDFEHGYPLKGLQPQPPKERRLYGNLSGFQVRSKHQL